MKCFDDPRIQAVAKILGRGFDPVAINWSALARQTGIDRDTLMRGLRPGYATARRGRLTGEAKAKVTKLLRSPPRIVVVRKPSDEVLKARLSEIPPDDRSITSRLFGDPLPGRSALDRGRA